MNETRIMKRKFGVRSGSVRQKKKRILRLIVSDCVG